MVFAIPALNLAKMLLLLAVLAVIAAAFLLIRYVKRQDALSLESNPPKDLSAENLRPLFAPTDDEIRAFEREESAKIVAAARLEADRVEAAKVDEIRSHIIAWRTAPDKQSTIDLLYLASQASDADLFSEVSEEILDVFRETGIGGLSPNDLAALFDSHYRLLPQAERSSGALFRLKQEIAELRSQSIDIES